MTKETRIYIEEGQLFYKWCWENWTTTCERTKLNYFPTSYTEINSKWIQVLNLRPEATKFLEESIGSMPFDSSFSNFFFFEGWGDLSTQARQTKAKITKWGYVKLKMCQQRKRQLTEWEKIFANNISCKKLISKMYKVLIQSTSKIPKQSS